MKLFVTLVALFFTVTAVAYPGTVEVVSPDKRAIGPDSESNYGFKGIVKNTETGQPANHATVIVPEEMVNGTLDKREQKLVQQAQELAERMENGEPVLHEIAAINGYYFVNGGDVPNQRANEPNPDKPIEDSPSKEDES